MLTEEAKAAAVKAKKKGLDFDAVFKLFDENHLGYVDLNDFKHMLGRLQLITQLPENQIPALLARFDKVALTFNSTHPPFRYIPSTSCEPVRAFRLDHTHIYTYAHRYIRVYINIYT